MQAQIKKFQTDMDAEFNEPTKQSVNALPDRKTASDFIQLIEELSEKEEGMGTSSFLHELDYNEEAKKVMETVENHGGEGQGENYYLVVKWNNQFWQVPGWYNSDMGGEYQLEDTYEVYPKIVASLEYAQIK